MLKRARERLSKIQEVLKSSPHNWNEGPAKPKLLAKSSGNATLFSMEASDLFDLGGSEGVLNLSII